MNNLPPFEEFYKANLGLVHKVARKIHARILAMGAVIEYSDVVQEATIVMLNAHSRFDESKGYKFSTYYMKACYFEINPLVAKYEKDLQVLGVMSMHAATDDEGGALDMEAVIDGHHDNPEQMLEAKQLLASLEQQLSPLANKILDMMIDPPEQIMREWQIKRELGASNGPAEMTLGFVCEYLTRVSDFTASDIRFAGQEIGALKQQLAY